MMSAVDRLSELMRKDLKEETHDRGRLMAERLTEAEESVVSLKEENEGLESDLEQYKILLERIAEKHKENDMKKIDNSDEQLREELREEKTRSSVSRETMRVAAMEEEEQLLEQEAHIMSLQEENEGLKKMISVGLGLENGDDGFSSSKTPMIVVAWRCAYKQQEQINILHTTASLYITITQLVIVIIIIEQNMP